jgi:hypothetical protein
VLFPQPAYYRNIEPAIEFNGVAFKHGVSEANRMTEEEADALDELWTRTTPPIRTGEGGPFTRQRDLLRALDEVTAN